MLDFRTCIAMALLVFGARAAQAQLVVSKAMTPAQLVHDVLLGGGVTASNVRYNGVTVPPPGQPGRGAFTATNTSLGLGAGVILSTGDVMDAGKAAHVFANSNNSNGPDPDLEMLAGKGVNDRSVLEFDFVPIGDTLRFRYVFASEEYPRYVCTEYNDVFGFFLSGPGINGPYTNNAANIALLPGSQVPVSINTVNSGQAGPDNSPAVCAMADPGWQSNSQYFVDNKYGLSPPVYDGYTVVLTAFALVQCGETYHIKLAIGDVKDAGFDSAVFLEAGSFASTAGVVAGLSNGFGVDGDLLVEGCGPYELVFTRSGDIGKETFAVIRTSGTAIPGVDYSPALPDTVHFPAGQDAVPFLLDVPMSGDGQRTVTVEMEEFFQCGSLPIQGSFGFVIESLPPLQVIAEDIVGACGQAHVLAPVVSGGTGDRGYLWSTGDTTASISVAPVETTTYTVTVSEACGVGPVEAGFTVELPVDPPMTVDVGPPIELVCMGTATASAHASGGNGVFTYRWTLNDDVVGDTPAITVAAGDSVWYVVTVTDGCGSFAMDSVLVTMAELPGITVTTNENVVAGCPGDAVTLVAGDITGGNGTYSLQWVDEDGIHAGTGHAVDVVVQGGRVYTLIVEDQCGHSAQAAVTVSLATYDTLLAVLTEDQAVCAGESVLLQALVTGGAGGTVVEWEGPGYFHSGPEVVVTPSQSTEYRVRVTDQCGNAVQGRVRVDVEHASVSIVVTGHGPEGSFLTAASAPAADTWSWDLGGGALLHEETVYHAYMEMEEHVVRLWTVTPAGCVAADSVSLKPPAGIYFPNAFTPDGDGINDLFGPVGHHIEDFGMIIFDRWGNEVFTTYDMAVRWDGRVRGAPPVNGVYVYKYHASGHRYHEAEGYGHVTVIAGGR